MLAHWNNSPRIDMSHQSDTLSWFRANQSFTFLFTAVRLEEKKNFGLTCFARTHDIPHSRRER